MGKGVYNHGDVILLLFIICFSHRCGLTNEDLNRKWSAPDPKLHPEIFHARVRIYNIDL